MAWLLHLAFGAGRALALLAALMLALVPTLPAHAHQHRGDGVATQAAMHQHESAADHGGEAGQPVHAGDCCFVSHVSVLPAVAAVPARVALPRDIVRSRDLRAPPDILAEALPEPPRPFA